MNAIGNLRQTSRQFGAGVVLGLCAVTPVFAASGDDPMSSRGLIFITSLGVLGLALMLRAYTLGGRDVEEAEDAPDLRWWKNQ